MAFGMPFTLGAAEANQGQKPGQPKQSGSLTVVKVRRDQALRNRWRHYGDTSGQGGWAGSDGTFSALLPDGRIVWMLDDTFLGPVNKDESLPADAPFIHNSMVVDDHGQFTTITGGTSQHPQSLVGPTPCPPIPDAAAKEAYWYWNADGIADGDKFYLFELKIVPRNKPTPSNFQWTAMGIATFSLPGFQLESVTPTYSAGNIQWGAQLFREGPHIYIYGVEVTPSRKYMHLARARVNGLLGQWEFYTGTGWSSDQHSSTRILGNVGSSYSVTPMHGEYVLITTNSFLGSEIYTYTAPSPMGPFKGRTAIYKAPEAGGDIYIYNVAAHPELKGPPDQLIISYNVNSFKVADLYKNINDYRGRFLKLLFKRN
jgi:hypothetical protein